MRPYPTLTIRLQQFKLYIFKQVQERSLHNDSQNFGRIVSAITSESSTIVIEKHPSDPAFVEHYFSSNGPYGIRVQDYAVTISDSSQVSNGKLQVLVIKEKTAMNLGYITQLAKPAKRGDTEIWVLPFNWWYDALVANKTRPFPRNFPLILRGTADFIGLERAEAIGYDDPVSHL